MTRLVAAVVAALVLLLAAAVGATTQQRGLDCPVMESGRTVTTTAPTSTTPPATTPAAAEPDAAAEVRLRRPAPPSTTDADLKPSSADVALPDARGTPGPDCVDATASIAAGGTVDFMPAGRHSVGRGFGGGRSLTRRQLWRVRDELAEIGVELNTKGHRVLPDGVQGGFNWKTGEVVLRPGATEFEVFHEATHARQWAALGQERYVGLGSFEREAHVFRSIWRNRRAFTPAQIKEAIRYMRRVQARHGGRVGLPHEYRDLVRRGLE